jgi:hypothetical protein
VFATRHGDTAPWLQPPNNAARGYSRVSSFLSTIHGDFSENLNANAIPT